MMAEKGRPLPKFGEWDVNDPSSGEEYTVIFNKARNEKKTGGKRESIGKNEPAAAAPPKHQGDASLGKSHSQPSKWFCCMHTPAA